MDSAKSNRMPVPWLAMVAAAAIGFLVARSFVGTNPSHGIPKAATTASGPQTKPAYSNDSDPVPAAPPPLPGAEMPLTQAFDALAARARHGDLVANDRLLRGLVRCRTYVQTGYNPYFESRSQAEAEAEAPPLRPIFESAELFCRGLSVPQWRSEPEWLERAAESGDAEAMLCFAVEPPMDHLRTLSPGWIETRRHYIAFARDYAERAFAQGYVSAAWVLYAGYAGANPDPMMRTYSIPPGEPDPARAYAFARLQAERLRNVDRLRNGIATEWADRADLLAEQLSPEQRERAEAFASEHATRTPPAARGLCANAMWLP